MSSYKIENLKLDFTAEDKVEAIKIRAANFARFTNDVTSWSARRTLDRAEDTVANDDINASAPLPVQQAGREAMSALKAALSAIRSKQPSTSGNSWSETVPPTQEETKIVASIAVDKVNQEVNTTQAKTAVNLSVRPLNKESFEIARAQTCKELDIPVNTEGGTVEAFFTLKAKLKSSVSSADCAKLIDIFGKMFPKVESPEDSGVATRIESIDGADHIVWTYVNKDSDEEDPLEKLLRKVSDSALFASGGAPLQNQVPGIFRLINARAELPHSLAEWIEKGNKSWVSLVEASRVSAEAILRRDVHNSFHEVLAATLLTCFDKEDAVGLLLPPFIHQMSGENRINLNMAPTELLYALLVKEASFFNRRIRETQEISSKQRRATEPEISAAAWHDTDAPECLTAYTFGSAMFLGATGKLVKDFAVGIVARGAIEAQDDGEADAQYAPNAFLEVVKSVSEIKSFQITGHTFAIAIDFEGVDDSIWKFFPTSFDGLFDAARPMGLAGKEEFDTENPDQDFEDEDDKKLKKLDLKHGQSWPQGVYGDVADKIVEAFGPGEYLDTDGEIMIINQPQKRNKVFRILVAVNSEDETKSWARLLSAFGAQVYDPSAQKKKKSGGGSDSDADSDDDDDDEEGSGLPDPTEGYMRVAYIRRPYDGRCIELVRPVSSEEFAVGFFRSVDAVVIVDAVEDIEFLKSNFDNPEGVKSSFEGVTAPVIFVSTKTDVANAEINGSIPETHFKPSAVDYKVLPEDDYSATAAADSMISFLISNSANPKRGEKNADPASPWDFAYEAKITIP